MSQHHQPHLPEALSLAENDPRRGEVEAILYAAELAELRALWLRTRGLAAEARRRGDIETVIDLVRGAKTIQRIADARGEVFAVRRHVRSDSGEGQ